MTQVLRGNIVHAPAMGRLDILEHGCLMLEDGVITGLYPDLPAHLEGAEVRDSIVMQGSRIGAGASIRYCILDKNVTIRPGTKLLGSKDHPLVVDKGDTV